MQPSSSSSNAAQAGGDSFSNPLWAGLQQRPQQAAPAPPLPSQQQQQHGGPVRGSGSSGGLYSSASGSTPAMLAAAPLAGAGVGALLQRVQAQVDATGR